MKERINTLLSLIRQKNQYFYIAIPLGAVLLIIIFTLILFSASSNKNATQQTPGNSITNNNLPNTFSSLYQIIKTSPVNNATGVGIYNPVSATFSKTVTPANQKEIILSFSPQAKGTVNWSKDGTTVTFTPQQPFLNDKVYVAKLSSGSSLIASWKFTIVAVEDMSNQDMLKSQQQAEDKYKKLEQQFYQKYSWYDSLPLQTDNYFVYFDTTNNKLIGILYPNTQSNISVDNQVNEMKNEILPQLQSLGIDTNQYPVNWHVIPEASSPSPTDVPGDVQ